MLDIAFESIGEVTSNSLLMFCLCNLIIVMIITGSLKPSSMDSQDSTFITSGSFNMYKIASHDHDCGDDEEEEDMTVVAVSSEKEESFINASIVSEEVEEGRESCHFCDDEDDDHDDNEEDDADDDNEDDGHDDNEEDGDDDDDKEAEVEEEEGDDDDLRKRVEEFIAKINNEWRHDKLRALNLVY